MKKLTRIIAFSAVIGSLAACQSVEEPFLPDQMSLTATTEGDGPETRTILVPAGTALSQVLWSEKDQIDVFMDGKTSPVLFTLAQGAGTKVGTFHGEGTGSRYLAFYPHAMMPSIGSGETVRFTLPATQQYAEGTFENGSFPMVASASSSDLQFRNLCSVLRLSMTGHNKVTRIVFRPKDASAEVCGKASVSLANPAEPVLNLSSNACDSLVLSVPGVKLDESEETLFYLVLPPQTYKGGFTLRIYSNERWMEKVYGTDFTMRRSRVHKADPFVFQPNGFDVSECLEGSGSQEDPFLIGTLGDLVLMRDAINSESGIILTARGNEVAAADACYRLTSDIDLSQVCGRELRRSWIPIGDVGESSFKGVFDGDGHLIDNLYINEGSSGHRGLFGFLKGSVRNLTVRGEVTGLEYCGLLAGDVSGNDSWIVNCTAKGSVSGIYSIGGLIGYGDNDAIEYCRNEATVRCRDYYAGGIIGIVHFVSSIDHCTNTGSVNGSYYSGGITGYANGSKVFNGENTGSVTGDRYVGGIGGYLFQGAKIFNSINSGSVKGKDFVGGVCGLVSAKAIAYQGPGTVANCVNLGKVEVSGGTYLGCLAGYAGLPADDTPLGDEPVSGGWVKNSYWLSESNPGIPAAGGGPGIVEGNFGLTDAQMKGEPCGEVLFQASSGVQYHTLIDALNAGAVAWSQNEATLGGDSRTHFPLSRWEYRAKDTYPSLSDLDAQEPGNGGEVFLLSDKQFSFNALSGNFQVDVTSSLGYSLGTLPSWIEQTKVVSYAHRPHLKTHFFTVAVNPEISSRSAVLTFTNGTGAECQVRVEQEGVSLETQTKEIVFDCSSGSKRLSFTSSTRWTVVSDAPWCTVNPQSGSGDAVISVRASENEGDRARSTTLTIRTEDGLLVKTVSVVQSGHTSGTAGDWKTDPFVHKSLAMRYTATWCGWCPRMNKSVHRAMELYPDKISYVALHGGGSDLQFNQVEPLMSQYGISGFPTGVVDGRIQVQNEEIETTARNIVNAVKETEERYGTVTGFEINTSVSGRSAQADVAVHVKKAGNYKITVLLLEDGIVNAQTNYEEGDNPRYVHDNVARVAMTDVLGEAFTVAEDFSVKNFSFSAGIPSSCSLVNLHVLVYVQRAFGSYPVIQSGGYGEYFVDNSADVALGENLKLALEVSGGGGSGSGGGGGDNEGIVPGDDIIL